MIATGREDAPYVALCLFAEDAYASALKDAKGPVAEVAPDPRLSPDWTVRGIITGQDAILRKGPLELGERVFYGWLLEKSDGSQFVIAIRGTDGAEEWVEDFEGVPVSYSHGGKAEAGFFGIYQSMAGPTGDLIPWLVSEIGSKPVTVTGHSLGAPLATYLGADLARAGCKVSARLFASPHPGDEQFCQGVAALIPDHRGYRYEFDLVPRIPLWLGYRSLPNLITIEPEDAPVKVRCNLACFHHAYCYLSLLDPSRASSIQIPEDAQFLHCIVR